MHDAETYRTVFAAAAALQAESLGEWRKHYYPAETLADALDLHATKVETTIEQLQRGFISVTVCVYAKDRPYEELYWYSLQRLGKGMIVRQESD